MTHDDGWDVSPSWQEVRAERDVLIAELRANAACIEGLQTECNALAADRDNWKFTYEALRNKYDARTGTVRAYEQSFKNLSDERDALAELVDHVLHQFDLMHAGDMAESDFGASEWEQRARAVRSHAKAEWQAEALAEAADDAEPDSVTAGWLRERAEMRRRQAAAEPRTALPARRGT